MKKIIIAAILLLTLNTTFNNVSAQSVTDHYERLYDRIYKDYIKEPNDVANMIDMAAFYADTLNPMRNYASAMKSI